jgi:hypothetical protein
MIPIYDFFFRGVGSTTNQITQPDHISSLIITYHHSICHDFPREKSMETERENYKMHADVEEPNQKTYGMFSGSLGS